MAKGTKSNKKQAAELPQQVKNKVAAKINDVEKLVASIKRRSDLTKATRELAAWLTSGEPVTDVSDESTKKQANDLLKKTADNMLKQAGLKEEKKKDKTESEALGEEGKALGEKGDESADGDNESE